MGKTRIYFVLALPLFLMCQSSASAQSDAERIKDLTYVLGASFVVPSLAAYCAAKDPSLIDAARRWNERHTEVMRAIASEAKRLKFFPDQKLEFNVESLPDKVANCRDVAKILDAGDWDFDKRPDIQARLSRLGISIK